MSIINFLIIVLGVSLNAAGQLFLKSGANIIGPITSSSSITTVITEFINTYIIVGLLCYVFSVLIWIVALTRVDVSIAYPMLSLGYVIVTIAAWFLFNEEISAIKILALSIIIFGIVLLANS
jgi:multidrug transporter EmrE-like cation transporter